MSVISRYQSNLDEQHWIAIKNILKYLRRTKDLILIFEGEYELWVEGYTNSNFMSNTNDRRSTSDFVFLCNDGLISWKSFKQSIIADSTIKAKYIIALETMKLPSDIKNSLQN